MKLLLSVLLTAFAASVPGYSQDGPAGAPTKPAAVPAAARILGPIPDGTPPPPAGPEPVYRVADSDILQTGTHEQGGRTITIRQIKPVPLPPPAGAAPVVGDAEFSERLAEYRAAHPKTDFLFLGATVFRSKDSPPRTLVRWWPQDGKGVVTFWSSADFALIAGGINSFSDTNGNVHAMLMGWGNVDLDRMGDLHAATRLGYEVPKMPDFPAGKATFQITGGHRTDPRELVVIQSLHDIYNSEIERLETAHAGRERARLEREAHLRAHPPRPKDITLNYWRTEKPAAEGKGETAR